MAGQLFPYGLGTDGKKGVHCIANILAEEVEIAMGLIGKTEPIAIVLNNIVAWPFKLLDHRCLLREQMVRWSWAMLSLGINFSQVQIKNLRTFSEFIRLPLK